MKLSDMFRKASGTDYWDNKFCLLFLVIGI